MQKWILPTISEVITLSEVSLFCHSQQAQQVAPAESMKDETNSSSYNLNANTLKRSKAEREWSGAIAAIEQLLIENVHYIPSQVVDGCNRLQGLVLAGPVPALAHQSLLPNLHTGIFTTEWLNSKAGMPFQLPPAEAAKEKLPIAVEIEPTTNSIVPLLPEDPLATEQFCLVLTARFSLVMVSGVDLNGVPAFMFTFEPEIVEKAWRSLRARVELTSSRLLASQLDALVETYYPVAPDYRTVTQFSRLLLKYLPEAEKTGTQGDKASAVSVSRTGTRRQGDKNHSPLASTDITSTDVACNVSTHAPIASHPSNRPDLELLQAFAHEVRTPLTTIRTLIRLLMKRRDLSTDVRKRLEVIEHECREQIDRMELMFKAAELETSAATDTNPYLIATSLEQVLQQSVPRWQHSAKRRNLTLDVAIPQQMPTVISHPSMLDQVLTGVIENFTRSLPAGSHIHVQIVPAGDQLKLQLFSQTQDGQSDRLAEHFSVQPMRKSLGQLLTFQPETGSISLNLTATKHLFQAIGGKLIVRQRPEQGEILTIFLPLVGRQDKACEMDDRPLGKV